MANPILLVDDDRPIRDLYQKILTDAGYAVDVAADGKEALAKIQANPTGYSLIILDIMMPQIDGIGILDTLNTQQMQHAPILLMTNLLNDPAVKEATNKGAIGCITKVNLDPAQFLQTVQGIVPGGAGNQPVATAQPATPTPQPQTSQPQPASPQLVQPVQQPSEQPAAQPTDQAPQS